MDIKTLERFNASTDILITPENRAAHTLLKGKGLFRQTLGFCRIDEIIYKKKSKKNSNGVAEIVDVLDSVDVYSTNSIMDISTWKLSNNAGGKELLKNLEEEMLVYRKYKKQISLLNDLNV